jgi:hypothetical protein
MNSKQKTVIYIAITIVVVSLVIWQIYGGEIFTKDQVLIEVKDELFGTTKEWKDQFVWGLDLSGIISGATIVVSGILFFVFRNKKK